MSDTKMGFGLYKNTDVNSLIGFNPDYVAWCVRNVSGFKSRMTPERAGLLKEAVSKRSWTWETANALKEIEAQDNHPVVGWVGVDEMDADEDCPYLGMNEDWHVGGLNS